MCGIAGVVDPRDPDVSWVVEAQVNTMLHRGPDSHGVHRGRGAAIGQTRLAVIDVVTGDPPVTDESGTIGAVLNGEIYNFQAIRSQLLESGHSLRSTGDTEVLAHLAEHIDPVELARTLEGMFAFAVWNDADQRLILGRDRLGKKPLYFMMRSGRFTFGSEIKAILADPTVPARVDVGCVSPYLTFGYVPSPRTFFEGVLSLPPGHVLVLDRGAEPQIQPYWQPPLRDVGARSDDPTPAEGSAELWRRLTAAVGRRLVSDVPLGAFLSGGVDSSAVVAAMVEVSPKPVHTFTIGFNDPDLDERPYARIVSDHLDTDHTEFVVEPNAVELVEELLWHHDQPFGDSSALPTYLLARETRGHVTVALSGDGGDELFAGYERIAAAALLDRWAAPLQRVAPAALRVARRIAPDRFGGRIRSGIRFLEQVDRSVPDALRNWAAFIDDESKEGLLGTSEDWGTIAYRHLWARSEGAAALDRILDLNLRTYLLDDLLPKADRMTMAHGLEVRSPLLDHDLVEFAFALPDRHKLRGLSKKLVLKRAVENRLPREVLARRKRGFGVPVDGWFRSDLRSYVTGVLTSPDTRLRRLVDPLCLDGLVHNHIRGAANHGHALWTLLTLELFLRKHAVTYN